MKIRALLFICCTSLMVSAVSAKDPEGKDTPKQTIHIVKMDKRVSELMADRVTIRKDMGLKELAEINARVDESLAANEDLLFPADELYGSNWDTRWVDPFRGGSKIEMPDSCAIDCSAFTLPIDSQIKVTSKYGPRRRRMHKGIDLKVQVGDTIRAAFDGKVRIRNFERRGYGNYLVVRHPNGLETVYGHLSKSLVDVNDIVRAGDPIALGGNTGRSTGSHLHFETRFLGQALNPADIIDFENGVPHQDTYVFHNIKINGRKSNIYTSSSDQMVYHRVKSGDTLGKIARMYGTTVNELCRLNGIKSTTMLRLGQSIRCSAGKEVAAAKPATKQTTAKTTTTAAKTTKTTTVEAVTPVASLTGNASTAQAAEPVYHRIKSGDTLGALASKYGTTVSKLCEMNGISKTTVLKLGRSIRCK
ncbi:peptidoglycan DD-metalloendopeptidase family protein [uncultured Parabacteroides sp.]|jgi:murein DD-endopeptidase MepM/ murein hydrolase activator NlpD|uniref:peptidoglycan DD-metalloendopeptidase family protein n=1 Tax=uncultured Parabacteroides sp. TaxID=512312 RepID=UPI0025D86B47|nr:peptidoglycan DD-metalloendopeptidase family protein [uncultured Parabacteroides sp.]